MATASSGYEPGDTVSYKRNYLGNWRDAKIVRIDTSLLLPLIIEDIDTGNEYSVGVDDVL